MEDGQMVRLRFGACFVWAFMAFVAYPAAAQDDEPKTTQQIVQNCFSGAKSTTEKRACIHVATRACLAEAERTFSSLPFSALARECYLDEIAAWQEIMDQEFILTHAFFRDLDARLLEWFRQTDAEIVYYETRPLAERMSGSQVAWRSYVKHECLISDLGQGNPTLPAGQPEACELMMVAERTIELWHKRQADIWSRYDYLK
ncbi:MAG: hypothetical protein GY947_13445 [Rhodobacteraceae bacterium]|nr:hypothetical protein [Paracoccaceae bacterium]